MASRVPNFVPKDLSIFNSFFYLLEDSFMNYSKKYFRYMVSDIVRYTIHSPLRLKGTKRLLPILLETKMWPCPVFNFGPRTFIPKFKLLENINTTSKNWMRKLQWLSYLKIFTLLIWVSSNINYFSGQKSLSPNLILFGDEIWFFSNPDISLLIVAACMKAQPSTEEIC